MPNIPFYQIDAFTSEPFRGNPAAVMPLKSWLPDETLLDIAAENNLSETAFLVQQGDHFEIRWFTPRAEVALCGHATMASAYYLFEIRKLEAPDLRLLTRRSGELVVSREGDQIVMDFPLRICRPVPEDAVEDVGFSFVKAYISDYLILELESEDAVARIEPNLELLESAHTHAVAVTAPSEREGIDFVSRMFAPQLGIPEDPVTGSLHCALADIWQRKLGKTHFEALQLSPRQGKVSLQVKNDRVWLKGQACLVIEGQFFL